MIGLLAKWEPLLLYPAHYLILTMNYCCPFPISKLDAISRNLKLNFLFSQNQIKTHDLDIPVSSKFRRVCICILKSRTICWRKADDAFVFEWKRHCMLITEMAIFFFFVDLNPFCLNDVWCSISFDCIPQTRSNCLALITTLAILLQI